jgi:tetrahydromethanopterin S-methyltransferase subunit G
MDWVSWILKYGAYTIIALGIMAEFLGNYTTATAYALGATTPMIIGAFVAVYCANKNASWASKIDRSMNLAFLIGIVFGLIGLFAYWILYKIRLEHPAPESRGSKIAVSILLSLTILIVGAMGWGATRYEEYEYTIPPPPELPTLLPPPAYYQYEKYGFSLSYPSEMAISEWGYLGDKANEDSGLITLENEKGTKVVTITWINIAPPLQLEDDFNAAKEDLREIEGITDITNGNIVETTKLGHRMLYQPITYKYDRLIVYMIYDMWYCDQSQKLYFLSVETYDEEVTNSLFNECLNFFTCH